MNPKKNHEAAPGSLQSGKEIVQNFKTLQKLGAFRLQPGQKLFEMVVFKLNGEPGAGLLPDGSFDPELAEVRAVDLSGTGTAIFGTPGINEPGLRGPIIPGTRRRLNMDPGNFYEVAINAKTARKKIIKKYFTP